jgi:hypothetical protein
MPVLIDPSKRPQRILAVLGMHRSGTSCLTGSLQAGGLFLGKHHTWNEYNRKGNRENQDVVNLHENIFKQNGASWISPKRHTSFIDNWFERPMQWHDRHYARAREILAEYAHEPLWGFKDPRALFLLHGWKQMVPDIEFVGIFRHPMAVAQSLNSRPALPITIEQGLQMWLAYNRALLKQYEQKTFPLFCFDWSEDEFHHKLDTLHTQLQLKPVSADQRFYTDELHKQKVVENAALPEPVQAMYERLKQLEYTPQNSPTGFDSAQPAVRVP